MKNLFIYFSIIFALAFAACSSDDENTVQKEETSKIDSTATFDDLDYLQNSLVRTDSLGNSYTGLAVCLWTRPTRPSFS